jgi:hypothetical protein
LHAIRDGDRPSAEGLEAAIAAQGATHREDTTPNEALDRRRGRPEAERFKLTTPGRAGRISKVGRAARTLWNMPSPRWHVEPKNSSKTP